MVLLNVAWICTMPVWTTRFSFFLKLFFLPVLAGALAAFAALAIRLGLRRRFLLVGYGAAARALAGARVGVGPLAPHRQAAAVPQAAVRSHLDVPLDIHRDFLSQIAFDRAFLFQTLADPVHFVFGQVPDLLIKIDA